MTEGNDEKCAKKEESGYKLYKRRWLMLALFVSYSINAGTQWVQFVVIGKSVTKYYNISNQNLEWTTEVFMLAYLLLVFFAMHIFNKLGIRRTMILGSFGICVGAWIKVFSVARDRFFVVLIGQAVEASFQVFTFSLASRVAAVWFPANEVSLAGSFGLFGDQCGNALSFIVPTLMVPDTDDVNTIGQGLMNMNLLIATTSTVIFLLIILFIRAEPKHPPSAAQVLQKQAKNLNVTRSLKKMVRNQSFILVIISYALILGSFVAFATVLSRILSIYFEKSTHYAGIAGFILMASGMIGSLCCGYFLDRKRMFKETALIMALSSFFWLLALTLLISYSNIYVIYLLIFGIGFSCMGYYTTGVQMGLEVTYPIPEDVISGVMLFSMQIPSLVLTIAYGFFVAYVGPFESTLGLCGLLAFSVLLIYLIPSDLKRQQAEKIIQNEEVTKTFLSEV